MNSKFILFLIFVSSLLISCSACKTEKEMGDKMTSANAKNKIIKKLSLPPGSAKIVASKSSTVFDNGKGNILVTVDKVLGYGSASPVLNRTQKITIKVSEAQKNKMLDGGESIKLLIKNLPAGRGAESSSIWKLISVE